MRQRSLGTLGIGVLLLCVMAPAAWAAPAWREVKSPHFVVWSNASDGVARNVAWRLEQVRSVVAALWPWAKVDLTKPMLVLAVKDENSMKALAPQYWQGKDAIHPVNVWVSGADRHYLLMRADIQERDDVLQNPYRSTYFAYVNLILGSSIARPLPLWLSRGLAGVFSNTLVRQKEILLGPAIPENIQFLRMQSGLPLKELIVATHATPGLREQQWLSMFDAESWALVHYLMFADNGARRARITAFVSAIADGNAPEAAFQEAFGNLEDVQAALRTYIGRELFSYGRIPADASVPRERFTSTPLTDAASAAGRALFHVAMQRRAEAEALIKEARNANPSEPDATVAEAVLLDEDGNRDAARAAYAKAIEQGTLNAYAWYRAATLNWPRPDAATLARMETDLAHATELNPRFADAWAALAEVRSLLKRPAADVMPLLSKAVALEPSDPWHRMTEARVLWNYQSRQEAQKAAQMALSLADTDDARHAAEQLIAEMK